MIGFIEWAWTESPFLFTFFGLVVLTIYVGAGKVMWFCLSDGAINSPALGRFEGCARFSVIALWPFLMVVIVAAIIITGLYLLIYVALGGK